MIFLECYEYHVQIRDIDEKGSLLSESNGGFLIYVIDMFLNTVYSTLGRIVPLTPRVRDAGSLKGRRCAFFCFHILYFYANGHKCQQLLKFELEEMKDYWYA